MQLERYADENDFEYKFRLCKAKINKEIDLDWQEIVDLLGINVHYDHLRKTAYGLIEYDNYINSLDGVATKILSISDLHVPFNLDISIFREYIGRVDVLVFNGDTEDCFSCSSFPKRYRVGLDEEMVATRCCMIDIINMIKPKKVFVVMGNHEYRLGRHLTDKLNDEIMTIMPDSPMELIVNRGFHVKDRLNKTETSYAPLVDMYGDSGIEIIYTGDWYVKIGKTLFVHPLSYSSGMLKTTEKAVDFFLRQDREFEAIVLGHTHKLGSYIQGGIKMYEQGCCCDLEKLDYNNGRMVLPGQNGFAYICQDADGNIIDDKSKLVILN